MVIVNSGGKKFYIDGYLKTNLDIIKKVIKKDWDMIFLIDGEERSGKSLLAMQLAQYCDPTFNLDRVCMDADEFKKVIMSEKIEKYNAVVYDEAYEVSSRSYMSKVNRAITGMLKIVGQKNLFMFIVLPSFFELDKYVAIHRSRALINVYRDQDFRRGFFKFFDFGKKRYIYLIGRKIYSYGATPANFFGSFTNTYVVDEKEYRHKKATSMTDEAEEIKGKPIWREQRNSLAMVCIDEEGWPVRETARAISKYSEYPLSHQTLSREIKGVRKKYG